MRRIRRCSGLIPSGSSAANPHSGVRPRRLLLLYWDIHTRQTALTVNDSELLYERGILSKDRTSVSLKHVRAVHVTQGFLNRILGVGTIQISTAGDQPEFTVADMPDPGTIREAISKAQNQGAD
jgi:uncharacterized membrane protein YdbT with pleckstrin-like domain